MSENVELTKSEVENLMLRGKRIQEIGVDLAIHQKELNDYYKSILQKYGKTEEWKFNGACLVKNDTSAS